MRLRQHRTIPALRLKHRSGGCGTASALPKCSIMSGCGTRIVLRGQKPLALCDRCPCFGSLFPPLAALTFAASSIICAFGLAAAAPRSPYRHLELCGIALTKCTRRISNSADRIKPCQLLSPYFQVHIKRGEPRAGALRLRQHRIIPALRLKHRSGGCGTASALPKCSIMSGCGTRIVLRGKAPRTLRPLPLLRFAVSATGGAHLAASSIIYAFWLSSCRIARRIGT